MKKFLTFLWRATIPILWPLSVLAIVRGGFNPGFVWPPLPVGQSYPYPWASVIVMSIVTAVECAFFYLILRPDRLFWSLPRAGIAFAVSLPLFILGLRTTPVDVAGNLFAFGIFNLLLVFLLFILLIITAMVTVVKYILKRMHTE